MGGVVKGLLTPRELAEAIGVSESSLKRWADAGLVKVSRTGGGHRRIALAEAIRFIREAKCQLVRPDIIGLPGDAQVEASPSGSDEESLFEYLQRGHAAMARSLVMSLYLAGRSVAEICDGPLHGALARIGELWRSGGDDGVFVEHRATDICVHALAQLRLAIDVATDAPAALGGAPPGDPYFLPSMIAALVLASEGMAPVNLGPDTPLAALRAGVARHHPRLVWLAVTAEVDAARAREVATLADEVAGSGALLVFGGQQRGAFAGAVRPDAHVAYAASMAELATLARRQRDELPTGVGTTQR
jgi:hypothetical protein